MTSRNRFRALTLVILGCLTFAIPACRSTDGAAAPPTATRHGLPHQDTLEERIYNHIHLLAHDELKGRGTGSDGIDLAAGYIAGQFAATGVLPGGPNGTYFQEFELSAETTLLPGTSLGFGGVDVQLEPTADFTPLEVSAVADFDGPVIFVGYGVTNPEKNHDDYAGINASGGVLLMLRREPPGWGTDGAFSAHARFDSKMKLAAEQGAVAVLVVNQDPGADGIDGLMRFRSASPVESLPALHIRRDVADKLLAAAGMDSLTALQHRLDHGATVSFPLAGIRAFGKVDYEVSTMVARNVIGHLPGTGPGADEFVVIGGHYDHLGERRGEIYNGADDNASGTAGVIEIARAFSQTADRNRSLLFIAFSAEEIGLHGSRHYVQHPTVDLSHVAAMINMDMIGRVTHDDEANRLGIHGLGTGQSFPDIVDRRTAEAGIPYIPEVSALGPSDHSLFYRAGIPALMFFTGIHADYHQPGDVIDKVNITGTAQIVRLVFHIAHDIVNAHEAPVFAEVNQPARIFRGPAPGRVVIGVVPDRDDDPDAPGWRIAQVAPNGAAAQAGMMSGDLIMSVEGNAVSNMQDYRAAVRDKMPGDVVQMTVQRGQESLTLSVELGGRE